MRSARAILGLALIVVPVLLASCDLVPNATLGGTPGPVGPGDPGISHEDLVGARAALTAYFDALNAGRYDEAAQLYGGGYAVLVEDNPSISADDHAALFEAACKVNGFQCLKIKEIIKDNQPSFDLSGFVVQFAASDGTVFKQPAIEGNGTQQPERTDFEYSVRKVAGKFLVQELPPYVP